MILIGWLMASKSHTFRRFLVGFFQIPFFSWYLKFIKGSCLI
jgi:hypothetical protein